MRFKLQFELDKAELPLEYRRAFLSFLKKGLTEYENGAYLDTFYGAAKPKNFCFAARLPQCIFEKDSIQLVDKNLDFFLSSADSFTSLILYNAMTKMKGNSIPLERGNKLALQRIFLDNQSPIRGNKLLGKFMMPLCVRKHDRETNQDYYYSFDHLDFQQTLKDSIRYQLATSCPLETKEVDSLMEDFAFLPVEMKKTVVSHYGQKIESSLGVFILTGHPFLLEKLYGNGMASKRSAGFGYFNVISEGGS